LAGEGTAAVKRNSESFLSETRSGAAGCGPAAQNQLRLAQKQRVFRRLGKRPGAFSFVVDSPDKERTGAKSRPGKGRQPVTAD
jgi:hypothetical protein